MTKKEFIKTAVRRGYCDFAQARDFCKRHPQPEYDESELDRLYEFASNREYHERTHDDMGIFHCKVTAEDMCSKMCYRSDIYRNHDNRLYGEIGVLEDTAD